MNETRLLVARMRTLAALGSATLHELRGAANALALQVELLTSHAGDGDPASDGLLRRIAILREERRRLVAIAEAFLRQAATPDSRAAAFDLDELCAAAAALTRPAAVQRGIRLEYERGLAPIRVLGRRDALLDVVAELLLDVLAGAATGSAVRVTAEREAPGGRVSLAGGAPSAAVVERLGADAEWAGARLGAEGSPVLLELVAAPADAEETDREA